MNEETKRVQTVGKPGQNTAVVTTQRIENLDLDQKNAFRLIKQAGAMMAPYDSKYLGSAVVHYYEVKGGDVNKPTWKTGTQVILREVQEEFADFGHKRLKDDMMEAYGRKVPKLRR